MKKIFFVLIIGLTVGCGITQPTVQYPNISLKCLIKHSDVLIATCDTTAVFIINNSTGDMIAARWEHGDYGNKTIVFRVDSIEFQRLSKKSKPCTCGVNRIKRRRN
jgi:hypothetical protein